MRNTKDNEDRKPEKRTVRKGGKVKASAHAAPHSPELQQENERERPTQTEEAACSPVKRLLTNDEFRARVSRKAYELYEKRRTSTQVDDWLEAERLVKRELLAEGQWAGSV